MMQSPVGKVQESYVRVQETLVSMRRAYALLDENSEVVRDADAFARAKTFILDGLTSGVLAPKIARTFPLEQIRDAHDFLESNEQVGKIVVTV